MNIIKFEQTRVKVLVSLSLLAVGFALSTFSAHGSEPTQKKAMPKKNAQASSTPAPTGRHCIVIGLGEVIGAAPSCAGCGPGSPNSGSQKSTTKDIGEEGFDWNDKPAQKYGKLLKADAKTKLPNEFHVVAANPKLYKNCAAAEQWVMGTNGASFRGQMKYVLVVEVGR
jgi:hypothetical protein